MSLNKTLHFFGDSWPDEGGEIDEIYKRTKDKKLLIDDDIPKSYPRMVSELLSMPYTNYAVSSTSQPDMIRQLMSNHKLHKGDHAIFSLTSPSRRFYYDDNNNHINEFCDSNVHTMNDSHDSYLSALTCYSLYNYCIQHEVTPWFINTFNVSYYTTGNMQHALWDEIPAINWIIPRDKCAVQILFDTDYFSTNSDEEFEYRNSDWTDWLNTNNNNVKKYIRPCISHPNLKGRMLIALEIFKRLRHYM